VQVLWDDPHMVTNATERARRVPGLAAVIGIASMAAGCHTTPGPAPAQPADSGAGPAVAAGPISVANATHSGARWAIDPGQTVVTVIVRRAGPLARFGHDHVITSADEAGSVWIGPTPANSAFELTLPLDRFEVDLAGARSAAGPEFATPVPDDARAGTRHNMLRTEVLDAATFPVIVLRSVTASGPWPQPTIRVAITLHGVTREQDVVVAVERTATQLMAHGDLQLNQSDFGITPFAVAGGAIQVADALEIRFDIAAVAP
jgi:polyisoprenoid-binding protein YceI